MPYADPAKHKAAQREVQFDRSRAVAIYRAALLWCRYRNTDHGRSLLARLSQMLQGELIWRREHNAADIDLDKWPGRRERQLLAELDRWERARAAEEQQSQAKETFPN